MQKVCCEFFSCRLRGLVKQRFVLFVALVAEWREVVRTLKAAGNRELRLSRYYSKMFFANREDVIGNVDNSDINIVSKLIDSGDIVDNCGIGNSCADNAISSIEP